MFSLPRFAGAAAALVAATICTAQESLPMEVRLHATGSFEVKIAPQPLSAQGERAHMSRLSLDKRYHGDLEAESQGEMLGYGDPKTGQAGYVAIEKVTGQLQGRRGSFALQHSSTMDGGALHQSILVVPGSGTEDLQGLKGSLVIEIAAGGAHSYRFDYTLPAR